MSTKDPKKPGDKKPRTPRKLRTPKKPERVEPTLGTPETPTDTAPPADAATPPTAEASAEVTVTVEASTGNKDGKTGKPAKPRVRVQNGETAAEAVKRERRKVLLSKSDTDALGDAAEKIVTRGGRPIFLWLLILILVFFGGWAIKEIASSWLSRQAPAANAPTVTVNPPDVNVTVNPPPAAAEPPKAEPPKPPAATPPRNTNPPRQAQPPRQPPRQTPPPASPPRATVPPAVGESLRPPGMVTPPGEQGVPPPPSAQSRVTKVDCVTERPFPRQFPNDMVQFDFKEQRMCYRTSANNRYQPPTGCIPYTQLSVAQKRIFDQYAVVYAKT